MSFPTRRGRPPKPRLERDNGTPELQQKRALGLTAEAIDQCLERRIITREEHWAGLHYRWLYTVRYGAPSISSHWWRLSDDSRGPRSDHAGWRTAREQEYAEARSLLAKHQRYEPVMQIAVYNDIPAFLRPDLLQSALSSPALLARIEAERLAFSEGLRLLARHWHRKSQEK